MIEIQNLQHGQEAPSRHRIGTFDLVITESDLGNITKLHQNRKFTVVDEAFAEVSGGPRTAAEVKAEVVGSWATTAHLDTSQCTEEAVLCLPDTQAEIEWDFCLIASFITGRRVCTPELARRFRPDIAGDVVVFEGLTVQAIQHAWGARTALVNAGVLAAFWSYIWSNDSSESLLKAQHLSAALNILYDAKWRESGVPLFSKDAGDSVRERLEACVDELSLDDVQKRELRASLGSVARPSAVTQLTHLLVESNLVDRPPTGEQRRWIAILNGVRNAFVHRSAPNTHLKGVETEHQTEANIVLVGAVLPALVRYLLAMSLELSEMPGAGIDRNELKEFFAKGEFRRHRVGLETMESTFSRWGVNLADVGD
jgi:hypothetical protein